MTETQSANPGAGKSARFARTGAVLRFAFIAGAFVFFVHRFWFLTDDAFISFRFSSNWADGRGLVYNPGESPPVEGYSNFLWVAIGALVHRLGLDLPSVMPLLSAACGAGVLLLLYFTLRRTLSVLPWPAAAATLTIACCPIFAVWCTSGMETMPFILLLLATFERLILRPDRPAAVAAGILAVLLSLIRVEGVCWALVLALLGLLSRRLARQQVARPLAVYLAILLAGYGLFFAYRYHYYGDVLSNTVHAKSGGGWLFILRGLQYAGAQFLTCLTLVLVLPGAGSALRRPRVAVGLPVLAMALAFPAYSVVVSGDFMPFGRFVAPMLPFLGVLIAWLVHDLARGPRWRRFAGAIVASAAVAFAALPAFDVHPVPESLRRTCDFRRRVGLWSEYTQWRLHVMHTVDWVQAGFALRKIARPDDSLAENAIGAIGFYSGLFVFDRCGLVTPEVARRPADAEVIEQPGHDRCVRPTWFLEHGHKPAILRVDRFAVPEPAALAAVLRARVDRFRQRMGPNLPYVPGFYCVRVRGRPAQQILICWWRNDVGGELKRAVGDGDRTIGSVNGPDDLRTIEIDPPSWAAERRPVQLDLLLGDQADASILP